MEAPSRLRIVSFNVNGLRAALKRKFGSVAELLQAVNADILCIQETKLRRCDVERDLAVVEGWDAFFACAQSPKGYSGTATYVRTCLALPCAAEEGFSGLCASSSAPSGSVGAGATIHPALAEAFPVEELQELDSEGRVVITDHGAFVLFNIYGPALTSEDPDTHEQRLAFKLRFYQALQLRWEDYLRQGRAVVAVGDLNICPAPLDTVDPDPKVNFYRDSRPDRNWLRNLLVPDDLVPAALAVNGSASAAASGVAVGGTAGSSAAGRFLDVFRVFHPRRQGAYTCWRTATSARVNNYGARIDLVLSAGLHVSATPPLPAPPPPDSPAAVGQQDGPPGASVAPSALRSLFLGSRAARAATAAGEPAAAPHLGLDIPGGVPKGTTQRQVLNATESSSHHGVLSSSSGREGMGCQVWLSASDIQADMEGSDHCPVWVDVSYRGRFPCAEVPPPTAARHQFTGKQLKLHSWLMRGGAAAAPAAAGQGIAGWALGSSGSQRLERVGEEGSGTSLPEEASRELGLDGPSQQSPHASSSKQASQQLTNGQGALGGSNASGVAAVGTKRLATSRANPASKKQASLRGFLARPTGSGMQPAQQSPQQCQEPPGLDRHGSGSAAAAVQQGIGASGGPSIASGPAEALPGSGGSTPLADNGDLTAAAGAEAPSGLVWDSQGGGSQQLRGGSVASTAEAAGAWRRIQQQMTVPRCMHGEPAALKRVNKSGPNHGRYFYVCQRPDGPKPEGQCSFFQWVKKRSGDHPFTLAGAKTAAVIGNRPKQ